MKLLKVLGSVAVAVACVWAVRRHAVGHCPSCGRTRQTAGSRFCADCGYEYK
ncbi:MAG: hypothetical protein QGF67_06050 [Lentisphaeria bacterium]|nr:hypothetical protein [Lentisphaeria bacterium]MDP7740981.1 hypothetical protein [Lentisphaeria bacterium]